MKNITRKILVFLVLIGFIVLGFKNFNSNKIDKNIIGKINNNDKVDVLITVKNLNPTFTNVNVSDSEEKKVKNREKYINEIKENAENSQKKIIDFIESNQKLGNIEYYYSYYITNTINIVATGEIIEEIAKFDEVLFIEENGKSELSLEENLFDKSELSSNTDWNLVNTYINQVHNKGIKGTGIVIGFLDSGVDYKHKDLNENWRGKDGDIQKSWFDVFGESNYPIDTEASGHGTAVTGIAVSKNHSVAPNSKWIAARAFKGKRTNNSDILKAAEWFLAPGGDASKAPDIINNSWGETSKSAWFDNMIKSWLNAGIIPVFASGNSKSEAGLGTIEYPASNLDIISVGAVSEDNKIGYFSKRGPSSLDVTGKIIKPEIVAPGVSVFTTQPGDGYGYWTGTSMATPNISGVIALMLESNNGLSNTDVKKILTITSTPLMDNQNGNSPNMTYGHGLVNAKEAVELALIYDEFASINRVFGNNRNITSIEIAKKFYDNNINIVYITNGNQYADGLSMGSLTKKNNGPLFLTNKDNVPSELKVMLNQLSPSKIIIIGGLNTVTQSVESSLREYASTVERISGNSRIDTSIEIAKRIDLINNLTEVFLVNAFEEADSINIVSVASRDGIPVLFTSKDMLSTETKDYLVKENIKKVTIIGGKSTVSQNVEDELVKNGITIKRLAGGDRFLTAVEVNKNYHSGADKIFFANGYNIADALTIGPVAGKLKAQIQILPANTFPSSLIDYYSNKSILEYYILGGINSITNRNAYNIFKLFK